MSLSQHIVEYTLLQVYNNEPAEYARAIGVKPSVFNKSYEKLQNEDKASNLVKRSIDLFTRFPHKLFEAVFTHTAFGEYPCIHRHVLQNARLFAIDQVQSTSPGRLLSEIWCVLMIAMGMIETLYCGMNCNRVVKCKFYSRASKDVPEVEDVAGSEVCPCNDLLRFMNTLANAGAQRSDMEIHGES